MAGQSPEGLPVVWRLVDHTAALPTVAHMVEPQCAGLTEGQPSLLVALIGPTTARVPSQRVSQLARLPVRRRLRLLAITHPTAIAALLFSTTILVPLKVISVQNGQKKLIYEALVRASCGMMTSSRSFTAVVITTLPNCVR